MIYHSTEDQLIFCPLPPNDFAYLELTSPSSRNNALRGSRCILYTSILQGYMLHDIPIVEIATQLELQGGFGLTSLICSPIVFMLPPMYALSLDLFKSSLRAG
jgi:hypothetical protein